MADFLERYGAPLVFAVVFLDQLGVPIPATPIVLAFGAMAGRGSIEPVSSLVIATAASTCASLVWFQVGRWKGPRVLGLICRISLEPDTCVARTQGLFSRHGVKSLLVAKFVPAFDILSPPLAGLLGVGTLRFLLWSAASAFLWLATFGGLGYAFSSNLEELAVQVENLGSALGLIVLLLLGAYVGWKFLERRRVLRALATDRILPEELQRMIQDGEDPAIVDVRDELAREALPFTIPGALFMTLDDLERRQHEIPREKDVVLYCS